MTMFKTNFCISTTAIHLLAMSPAKKTSENKDYSKIKDIVKKIVKNIGKMTPKEKELNV